MHATNLARVLLDPIFDRTDQRQPAKVRHELICSRRRTTTQRSTRAQSAAKRVETTTTHRRSGFARWLPSSCCERQVDIKNERKQKRKKAKHHVPSADPGSAIVAAKSKTTTETTSRPNLSLSLLISVARYMVELAAVRAAFGAVAMYGKLPYRLRLPPKLCSRHLTTDDARRATHAQSAAQ